MNTNGKSNHNGFHPENGQNDHLLKSGNLLDPSLLISAAEIQADTSDETGLRQVILPDNDLPIGMEPLVRNMLLLMGEDPDREGLQRTPERVARMYHELLAGYHVDLTALVNEAVFESEYQNMVLVGNISFYSMCEHHLLPFYGQAHVAYIPDGKIIGLSKIPRLVEMYARRLQVQERMTQQIADTLQEIIRPRGVAVYVEGAHMCAMMRGVKKSEARMTTSVMTGVFEDPNLRNDFFNQLERSKKESSY